MTDQHPRLARDVARAFVTACESGTQFVWLSDQVRQILGPSVQKELAHTRHRLVRPARLDARQVEAGTWYARMRDLLYQRPDLDEPLRELISAADGRLTRQWPYWPVN